MPETLKAPSDEWRGPFAALARECGLSEDLDEALRSVDAFLKSVS